MDVHKIALCGARRHVCVCVCVWLNMGKLKQSIKWRLNEYT